MNYYTHLTVGAAVSQLFAVFTGNIFSVLIGSLAGSLVPDVDHPKSFSGRRIPIIPKYIYKQWGHRTITHSIGGIIGFMGLFIPLKFVNFLSFSGFHIWLGVLIGCLSHIIADLLNPSGVCLFFPYKYKVKLFGGKIFLYSTSELIFAFCFFIIFLVLFANNLGLF